MAAGERPLLSHEESSRGEGDEEWSLFIIEESRDGNRLDRTLADLLPQVGRRLAAQLCDAGAVLLDGRRAKKSAPVSVGQRLEVKVSHWGEALPAPALPLELVLERPDFVVALKPAGIATGAVVGREEETLAGALLARFPEMKGVGYGPREPGVLHRLDLYTSGLVVAARNQATFDRFRASLSAGLWTKKYFALVPPGLVEDQGVIEGALRPSRGRAVEVVAASPNLPSRRTSYRVVERHRSCDWIEVTVAKAYRHQIRAHFASIGAPLLGDELYGGVETELSPRHALHASYIACSEGEGPSFEVEAPLPEDLSRLLED